MRSFVEESAERLAGLVDGVWVYHDHEWPLVLAGAGGLLAWAIVASVAVDHAGQLAIEYRCRIEQLVPG